MKNIYIYIFLPRATHCTDRAQTSGNVSPTVELCPPHPTFGTKVRARRDVPEGKKKHKYTYTYIGMYLAYILSVRSVKSVKMFQNTSELDFIFHSTEYTTRSMCQQRKRCIELELVLVLVIIYCLLVDWVSCRRYFRPYLMAVEETPQMRSTVAPPSFVGGNRRF